MKRLGYTPQRSLQVGPDGETGTVFEALRPGGRSSHHKDQEKS